MYWSLDISVAAAGQAKVLTMGFGDDRRAAGAAYAEELSWQAISEREQ